MYIVTAKQMRIIEDYIFANGMPVAALMEKAGLQIAKYIKKNFLKSVFSEIGVLVGPGHNGGDALVVARELLLAGYNVKVFLAGEKRKELTEKHLQYYSFLQGSIVDNYQELTGCSLILDGLFGFGLERNVSGIYAEIIEYFNAISALNILAIDLPSGLHTDTGMPLGNALKVRTTLCLGLWKTGLVQLPALEYAGNITVLDLGYTPEILASSLGIIDVHALQNILPQTVEFSKNSLAQVLQRSPNCNKYSAGRCLLLAGSEQYPGAGILAALGARAAGVGYLTQAATTELINLFIRKIPELVCIDYSNIEAEIVKSKTILFGSGLGSVSNTFSNYLKSYSGNLVVDADALSYYAQNMLELANLSSVKILTPHWGEFVRLFPHLECTPKLLHEKALLAAKEANAIVVLKGPRTVIATPDGKCKINVKSTPALARAGTGDVLAGFLTGLLALGLSPVNAAELAVFLHSKAARSLQKMHSILAVDPEHLANKLRTIIKL